MILLTDQWWVDSASDVGNFVGEELINHLNVNDTGTLPSRLSSTSSQAYPVAAPTI